MNRKGMISTINANTIRVIFPELNDAVSYELELAAHIDIKDLYVGNKVIVAFYNEDLKSGIVIAKVR